MQVCTRCKVEKDFSEFYKRKVRPDGSIHYRTYCKICSYAQVKEKLEQSPESKLKRKKSLQNHGQRPHKILQNRRAAWKAQGIDPDIAEEFWKNCKGQCAICGGDNNGKALHVDHNHQTGKVRAMLCQSCNTLLGAAKESRRILIAAIGYLDLHDEYV